MLAVDEHGDCALTNTAPLSKITLIYGPNSGGKSSIIQSLLLLKQSLKSNYGMYDHRNLVPGDENSLVDLGSIQSMIHRHETVRELGIDLSYQNVELARDSAEHSISMRFRNERSRTSLAGVGYRIKSSENEAILLDADADIETDGMYSSITKSTKLTILGFESEIRSVQDTDSFLPSPLLPGVARSRKSVEQRLLAIVDMDSPLKPEYRLLSQLFRTTERTQKLESLMQWAYGQGPDELAPELARALEATKLTTGQVFTISPEIMPLDYEAQLNLINYLGPLRSAPERIYRVSPEFSLSTGVTGIQGEFSANALYHEERFCEAVNYWFNDDNNEYKFDIPYKLYVKPLGDPELSGQHITIALYLLDNYGNEIKDNEDKAVSVTLADVGYGINQLLPVVIEGIASQEGSIICVEQPEIHLHPRLQANIADLMIDTIANERGKRKQWIVETHSELLILRLQRRIREGKIKPEDISVLYVDPNDESTEGSAIKVLRLGEDSYFKDPWPDGFFDDGLKERLPDDNEFESSDDDTNILDKLFSE